MRRFLVTGASGAGKTAVARQLRAWGHLAISADGDRRLSGWEDAHGARVPRPREPDAAWLAEHRWMWSQQRLEEILADAGRDGARTVWVCGRADNALLLADRFTAVFLLEVDQRTMAQRIRERRGGNDFGRVGDTLADALAGYHAFVAAWRRFGAYPVDATRDIRDVGEELLLSAAAIALRR